MPLPIPVMYRIEENPQGIVVPGRRLPQVLKLWMTLEGALILHDAVMQAIIAMPRDPEAVWGVGIPTLRMRHEQEPRMYAVPKGAVQADAPPDDGANAMQQPLTLVVNREAEPAEVVEGDPAAPKVVEGDS